ncbi:hypothetical protein [Prosthecomicrobium sp. N25]|uniref:hypothetical protein n=1 Tax=Prosthecomicrobium sp. N25 TaxID=3129254 RepID=UPI0030787D4B
MKAHTMMRHAGLFLSPLLIAGSTAFAADKPLPAPQPPPAVAPYWTFSASAYAWAAGLRGDVRTLPPLPAVRVDIGFGQVLKDLTGALMGTFEAQHDRFIVFTDIIASCVSSEHDFVADGFPGSMSLKTTSFTGTGMLGYRIWDDPRWSFDVLAGARLWAMDNTLGLTVAGINVDYGKSKAWVDGVAGGRVKINLTDHLFLSVIGLVGGLSSKIEWDVYGVGYAFNDSCNAFAGYRVLHLNYESGNFLYNVTQKGPVLGVTYKFLGCCQSRFYRDKTVSHFEVTGGRDA